MDNIIRFPREKTRTSELEYDLETVQIIAECLEDIMEDRGYEINKPMVNDLKVLVNLAYASVRRQATEEDLHPFHETMEEIAQVIEAALIAIRGEEDDDEPTNDN